MSHCLNIDVHGEQLWLLGDKALYWPARRVMLVADVHIGKAAAFRAQHLPVPRGTTQSTLQRLDRLLTSYPCEELIVLGDFLHARSGAADALWQQLLPWRQRHARVAMTLVRGNHDLHAGDPPASLAMALVHEPWQPCATVPVLACHHPQAVAGHTVIAGHLHPTLRLRGPGRDTMRTPCFGWGEGQLVLPAFGAFTGTSPTALPRSWARFAVTPGRVVAIPAGAC